VLGYYAHGDGGGGLFCWDNASSRADDGGLVIKPSSFTTQNGRWLRTVTGPLDVKWFGAKGDGKQDDAPAIQRAIDAAYTFSPTYTTFPVASVTTAGSVYVPTGEYRLASIPPASATLPHCPSQMLTLYSNVKIFGAGSSSRLRMDWPLTGADWTRLMGVDCTSPTLTKNVVIRDLLLDGGGLNVANGQRHLIFLRGAQDTLIDRCEFQNTEGDGVYMFQGPGENNPSTGVVVTNSVFHNLGRVPINFSGASHSVASNNVIHDVGNNAIKTEDCSGVLTGNRVTGNKVIRSGAIFFGCPDATRQTNLTIEGNYIEPPADGFGIGILNADGAQITGNQIKGGVGTGITIDRASQVLVAHNVIRDITGGDRWSGAITVGAGAVAPVNDLTVADNLISNINTRGIRISRSNGGRPSNITVRGNTFINTTGNAIEMNDTDTGRIESNTIRNSGGEAIAVSFTSNTPAPGKHIQILSNRVFLDPQPPSPAPQHPVTACAISMPSVSASSMVDYAMVTGNDVVGIPTCPIVASNLMLANNFGL
jgi:polygalacturonase